MDVNQFIPGRSAYECVAYSGALCKYMGQPGAGPTGSAMQVSNLAQYQYGLEEGSNTTANTNGMSLDAEYDMLNNIGLSFQILEPDVDAVRAAIAAGRPVLVCGAETGMFDIDLGDRVPYSWTPTGNHCIVVSGVHADGNLLVHDCASIDANGVRPGPRLYDASKMHLVSATAIVPPWQITPPQEKTMIIDLTIPEVAHYFQAVPGNDQQWKCVQTGKIIQYGILAAYQQWGNSALCGLSYLGLPNSSEIPISGVTGAVKQFFERGCLVWDPSHKVDNPPGVGSVYAAHLYNGVGVDPMIAVLEAKIADLMKTNDAQALAAIKQIKTLVAPFI